MAVTTVEADAGSGGALLAVDTVSTASYPISKLDVGAAGSASLVTAGNPLPTVLEAGTAEIGKLAAGTAAIGKLAANSGVDIGDVDVLSSALPTGASTSAKQDLDNALLTTIDADTSTIAGDTTSIDGNITACNTGAVVLAAGTAEIGDVKITDGTETANVNASNELQVRDDDANTDLDTIAGDTTSMDGKITACNTGAVFR